MNFSIFGVEKDMREEVPFDDGTHHQNEFSSSDSEIDEQEGENSGYESKDVLEESVKKRKSCKQGGNSDFESEDVVEETVKKRKPHNKSLDSDQTNKGGFVNPFLAKTPGKIYKSSFNSKEPFAKKQIIAKSKTEDSSAMVLNSIGSTKAKDLQKNGKDNTYAHVLHIPKDADVLKLKLRRYRHVDVTFVCIFKNESMYKCDDNTTLIRIK